MRLRPESIGPVELERLWEAGEPLTADALPTWLEAGDAWYYRRVAGASLAELDEHERLRLEEIGLVLDETGIYVPDQTDPVWSIGLYAGRTLFDLAPWGPQPVLTRDDVTDVVASYVADPFLLRGGGRWNMLFEVYDWAENKGAIGLATSEDSRRWSYEGIVLSEEFHLSYPFVFEWDGEHYLVPESHQADEVRLYRASRFPTEWEPVSTLLEGPVADATLLRADGRWWLFGEASSDRTHDTLRLYQSERLEGPWREHPSSPIVADDPRRARPAGRIVSDGARIVRFAQDCSETYGKSVLGFEITELSATGYSERPVSDRPLLTGTGSGWNAGGMHHVDPVSDLERGWMAAVDGWALPVQLGALGRGEP